MRRLRQDLIAVFDAPVTKHAQWSVLARSLDTGEVLFARDDGKLMMPASNMKIVTLAAAAQTLGWDHRFVTTLETAAAIRNGSLAGDLIVRGGGDPTIGSRGNRHLAVFDEWAAALRAAGVERIDGRIVGDDQAFDDEGLGGGWAWDYLQYGYAAPIGALQYNENAAPLTVSPGSHVGEPAVVQLAAGSGLVVNNLTVTGAAGTPETIAYRRYLDRPVVEVTGSVPVATAEAPAPAKVVQRQVAVVNPTRFFAQALKDALISRGIPVSGDAADLDDLAPAPPPGSDAVRRVLASTSSPPLGELAAVLMKVSQNQYAETLLKAMADPTAGPGSVQAGRAAVLRVLGEWQIDASGLVMTDGSGLSRYNYVTAELLTRILERMYADPRHREPFMASLPVAGREGTLATRLRRTRAEGNARAKTGSISNVRTLSGYLRTRDGEMLVFSILANSFAIPAASVDWIADLGVEVLANFARSKGR